MVSSVALKEIVLDVSPLAKVTLSGTLKSAEVPPLSPVPVIGMVTDRWGSALSVTVTSTESPSSAE